MSAWLLWRLLKFLGLTLLAGGTVALLGRSERRGRLHLLHWFVSPGFLATWTAGLGLMLATGRFFDPWILGGMGTSLVSFHLLALFAYKSSPKPVVGKMALSSLLAAVPLMVIRPETTLAMLPSFALGAALGFPLGALVTTRTPDDAPLDEAEAHRWFRVAAWGEGATLVLLLLINVPLKYTIGFELDGGTGLLGAVHGVFFLVYLQALMSVGRALSWPGARLGIGVLAALLPFGTFVFEARTRGR